MSTTRLKHSTLISLPPSQSLATACPLPLSGPSQVVIHFFFNTPPTPTTAPANNINHNNNWRGTNGSRPLGVAPHTQQCFLSTTRWHWWSLWWSPYLFPFKHTLPSHPSRDRLKETREVTQFCSLFNVHCCLYEPQSCYTTTKSRNSLTWASGHAFL